MFFFHRTFCWIDCFTNTGILSKRNDEQNPKKKTRQAYHQWKQKTKWTKIRNLRNFSQNYLSLYRDLFVEKQDDRVDSSFVFIVCMIRHLFCQVKNIVLMLCICVCMCVINQMIWCAFFFIIIGFHKMILWFGWWLCWWFKPTKKNTVNDTHIHWNAH